MKKVVYGPRRKFRVTRKIRQEGRGDVLPLETAVERGLSLERQRVNERVRERRKGGRGEKMRGGKMALSDGLKNNWLAATREF